MNEFENRKNINQNDGGTQKKSYRFDVIALVLCLVIAIGIWLYVMNSNQETAEKTIIITIDAIAQVEKETNMSIITGSELMDYSKIMVELTVTGTKSAIEKYDDSQYVVELDTSALEEGKAGKYNFSFKYTLPGNDVTFKSMSPSYISTPVLVDVLSTVEVPLKADYKEGGISSGTLESLTPKNLDKVSVSGPKSIIDTVGCAIVNVNLAGYEKSTDIKSKTFEFVDRMGAPINNDYNYIKVNPSEVEVHLQINYTDKTVPISVKFTASDTDVYKYDFKVSYADNTDALLALTGDSLLFPESLVYDLGDITSSQASIELLVEDMLKLDGFIPEGLTVGKDYKEKIIVTITKTKIESEVNQTPESTENTGDETTNEIPA